MASLETAIVVRRMYTMCSAKRIVARAKDDCVVLCYFLLRSGADVGIVVFLGTAEHR